MITPVQSQRYARMVRDFTLDQAKAYQEHLIAGKPAEDFFEKMEKHGNHDQRSHGSWAHGGGDNALNNFEKAVNDAYGTGEDAFTISHAGDESVAALGKYLAKGHTLNDIARAYKNPDYVEEVANSPTFRGLDNAIEMAPPIPNQKVWRTTSAEVIESLKKNGIYLDRGYTSTTAADITHPDNGKLLLTLATVSSGRKAIMQIDTGSVGKGIYIPKMFPGQPIAEFEKEFLMPRNTKMKYLGPDYIFTDGNKMLEIHRFKVVN